MPQDTLTNAASLSSEVRASSDVGSIPGSGRVDHAEGDRFTFMGTGEHTASNISLSAAPFRPTKKIQLEKKVRISSTVRDPIVRVQLPEVRAIALAAFAFQSQRPGPSRLE